MWPLCRFPGVSTSATGFAGSPYTFRARAKMPCNRTSGFVRVLEDRSIPAIQRSITAVVIDSIGRSPNAGSNCERTHAP
jgi:hypothetical protein